MGTFEFTGTSASGKTGAFQLRIIPLAGD